MNRHPYRAGADRAAFTLIELLTVIAIIGILAAIIIPTVGKVRDSARNSQSVSNLRQLAMAAQVFTNDNGFLPGGVTREWWVDIGPYVSPATPFQENGGNNVWFAPNRLNAAPNVEGGNLGTYGMNRWLFTRAGTTSTPLRVRLERVGDPSRKSMLMEAMWVPPGYFTMGETAHYIYNAYRSFHPMNDRDIAVAFVDAHVKRMTMNSILTGDNANDSSLFWGVMAYD